MKRFCNITCKIDNFLSNNINALSGTWYCHATPTLYRTGLFRSANQGVINELAYFYISRY